MLLLTRGDSQLRQRLAEELVEVEARFASELTSDLACVNELVQHVERYRGKMLRPTLVMLSGMVAAPEGLASAAITQGHRDVAAVVEMVHVATLVHDDVLDDARTRRRAATVNHLTGTETAVMLGDYLFSHAFHLCTRLEHHRISRLLVAATNTVCEGELLQLAHRNDFALDEATYFEIIRRKTAALCRASGEAGALLHDAAPNVVAALSVYSERLGMAFQIVDDLLDLVGSERAAGKTLGRDVAKGKLTLPLIHHLTHADGGGRQEMLALLEVQANGNGQTGPDSSGAIIERLEASGSIDYSRQRAGRLIEQAVAAVGQLPASSGRDVLQSVAEAVLARQT